MPPDGRSAFLAGETGAELAVAWREGPRFASYAVVPVFQIGTTRVEGERATCTVDFMLRGLEVMVK